MKIKRAKQAIDPLVLRMRDERRLRKMSQLKAARILGVTSNTITYWETGKRKPTRRNRARINKWLEGESFEGRKFVLMTYAVKMRKMRSLRRITLSEFSRSIGIGVSTISNWENGVSKPSEMNLQSIKEWEMDNPALEN